MFRQLGHHSVAFTLEVYAHLIMEEQDLSKLDLGVVAQTAADGDLGAERTIN